MPRRTVYLVVAVVLLLAAGCASGDGTGSGTTPTGDVSASSLASTSDQAQKVVEVGVSVHDGKVSPKPRRVAVPLGSQVRMQITSDVDDEVHVHGYDVEETLEAGRTTTVELQADQPGLFEVETHESELELLQLEVR